jgi:uncharacterized membrane protein YfcA
MNQRNKFILRRTGRGAHCVPVSGFCAFPMLTLPLAAAFAASVLATSFLSGIFGMAGGMILMGLLLAMLPLAPAMLLHGVTQLAANGWRAWLWRTRVRWRSVAHYGAAAVLTACGFALLPFAADKATALVVLGAMPFLAMLLPRSVRPDAARAPHMWGCGAVCTVLQLLAGVSGPILDLFFVDSGMDRKQVVATKAAIQVFSHALKIVYFGSLLAWSGNAGSGVVGPLVLMIAVGFAVTGTNLSRRVLDAISDLQFRAWTQWIVLSTAAVYLAQGLHLMLVARSPA